MVLFRPGRGQCKPRPTENRGRTPPRRADTLRTERSITPHDSRHDPCPDRADALRRFAETALAATGLPIEPASADASFRSYWRVDRPRDAHATS